MILFIDSTDYQSVMYAAAGEKFIEHRFPIDPHESHKALKDLEGFLKKNRIGRDTLQEIVVCSGPGSYTGVRVGLAHAKALGLAWSVKVTELEKKKFDIKMGKTAKTIVVKK